MEKPVLTKAEKVLIRFAEIQGYKEATNHYGLASIGSLLCIFLMIGFWFWLLVSIPVTRDFVTDTFVSTSPYGFWKALLIATVVTILSFLPVMLTLGALIDRKTQSYAKKRKTEILKDWDESLLQKITN